MTSDYKTDAYIVILAKLEHKRILFALAKEFSRLSLWPGSQCVSRDDPNTEQRIEGKGFYLTEYQYRDRSCCHHP